VCTVIRYSEGATDYPRPWVDSSSESGALQTVLSRVADSAMLHTEGELHQPRGAHIF
jgi:hypothetical protein